MNLKIYKATWEHGDLLLVAKDIGDALELARTAEDDGRKKTPDPISVEFVGDALAWEAE
jgi:hypothetical protein